MADSLTVGERIRRAREARSLSREQLADLVDVHPGSVARWETGGSSPQRHFVRKVAGALRVAEAWLEYGEGSSGLGRDPFTYVAPKGVDLVVAERNGEDGDGPASVPGFTMLVPRAREVFEAWYYELLGRKLPPSEVMTLATETLGPISRLGTIYQKGEGSDARTEEEQLAVIVSNRDFIRRRLP